MCTGALLTWLQNHFFLWQVGWRCVSRLGRVGPLPYTPKVQTFQTLCQEYLESKQKTGPHAFLDNPLGRPYWPSPRCLAISLLSPWWVWIVARLNIPAPTHCMYQFRLSWAGSASSGPPIKMGLAISTWGPLGLSLCSHRFGLLQEQMIPPQG